MTQKPRKEEPLDITKPMKKAEEDDGRTIRDFDKDIMKMYMNEPFLGSISMRVTKMKDNKMPTAYITYRNIAPDSKRKDIMMGLNTKFLAAMKQEQRVGIFKHELFHFIFQHLFNRSTADKRYHKLQNIAQDLAINSIIGAENLPSLVLIPGRRPLNPETMQPEGPDNPYADYIENAEPMHSSEKYFQDLLKIQQEQQEQNGGGEGEIVIDTGGVGTIDDHDVWDDLPEEVKEELRAKAKQIVGEAASKADRDNNWGSIPQQMREEIRKMTSNEVSWENILKSFIGRTRSMAVDSTIKKIDKKVPYVFPGIRRQYTSNFVCFVDSSGSMANEDIALLFGELENLAKRVSLDVYYFDTQVDLNSHLTWKKGKPSPKIRRPRCGGTDVECIAEFLRQPENRSKWSGAIILTDGYFAQMTCTPGTRILWVVTPDGTANNVRQGDLVAHMKRSKGWQQK